MHTHMHLCTHTHVNTHSHPMHSPCTCSHTPTHTHMRAHTHKCTYAHSHMPTHMHTHVRAHTRPRPHTPCRDSSRTPASSPSQRPCGLGLLPRTGWVAKSRPPAGPFSSLRTAAHSCSLGWPRYSHSRGPTGQPQLSLDSICQDKGQILRESIPSSDLVSASPFTFPALLLTTLPAGTVLYHPPPLPQKASTTHSLDNLTQS